MSDHLHVDLIVVGLGPAGACAAAAAAKAGARVIAIDRKSVAGVPVQCAEFVPGPLFSQISDLAATSCQTISAMTTMIETMHPYHSPDFRGAMIDRVRFDQMLVAEAQRAGAHIILGAKLAAVEAAGLRLLDSRVLEADIVIGADGPRSMVGRAIGQVNCDLVETRQITVSLLRPSDSTDIFLCSAYRGGYAWLFPKGDVAHIGIGVLPSERERLKLLLHRLHLQLIEERGLGREVLALTGGVIPVGGMLQPFGEAYGRTILLAGDAAGLTHPVTGAGIAAAVLSGRMAGEAAVSLLNGQTDAARDYGEDLADVFGVALDRALMRRRELLSASAQDNSPGVGAMRRSWIAFPEYWDHPAKFTIRANEGYYA